MHWNGWTNIDKKYNNCNCKWRFQKKAHHITVIETEKILTFQFCTYKVHKKQLTNTCIRPFDVRHFGHNHHSSAMRMIDMNICRFIWIWCCRFWIWLNEIMPQSSMKLNISRISNVCVCVYLVGQSKWIFRQLFKNWILWTKHLILFAAQQTIHNEKKPILALVRHFTLAMCSHCMCSANVWASILHNAKILARGERNRSIHSENTYIHMLVFGVHSYRHFWCITMWYSDWMRKKAATHSETSIDIYSKECTVHIVCVFSPNKIL